MSFRVERDSMGEIQVPSDKHWGAQTQRSFENFQIGTEKMPRQVIRAFAVVKKAAALTNKKLGLLDEVRCTAICHAADEVYNGQLYEHFPLAVWQTGSGTQSNMNINEVIAHRAMEIAENVPIHPNDHVNKSQSSNDTFPSAMHIAAVLETEETLLPAISRLAETFKTLSERYAAVVKTGRTHLQDATPLTLGQEISGWHRMLEKSRHAISKNVAGLYELALGGTAVGTGLNTHPDFAVGAAREIAALTNKPFITAVNKFHALTSLDAFVCLHGSIKALASDLMKIANDVRWLASGPRCGIGELTIPANEPGSSIMPGKVNPTQAEALTMVVCQVMGNDTTISMAASQGNFQLNVFLPVTIYNFLQSVTLLADSMDSFNKNCAIGITPNYDNIAHNVNQSLMLVTALNTHIGYDNAALIAKTAHAENCTLKEAAVKSGLLTAEAFDRYVRPENMTTPGITSKG